MKRLLIVLILINLGFIINEGLVSAQEFESWGMQSEIQTLNKYKTELQTGSIQNSSIEAERDYIGQAINNVTDSICSFDSENLNDRYTKLDEAVRAYQNNPNSSAEESIRNTEVRLKADLIKAIDNAIRTNLKCENVHESQKVMKNLT